jgi:hypothetical protein
VTKKRVAIKGCLNKDIRLFFYGQAIDANFKLFYSGFGLDRPAIGEKDAGASRFFAYSTNKAYLERVMNF